MSSCSGCCVVGWRTHFPLSISTRTSSSKSMFLSVVGPLKLRPAGVLGQRSLNSWLTAENPEDFLWDAWLRRNKKGGERIVKIVLFYLLERKSTIKEKLNGAAFHLTFITRMLEETNKTKQQLTKAFCSWAVSRVQTRPPFRSLQRRKRRGHRASCRRAGREVWVKRQQGWQEHWKLSGGPQQRMENGDDGDDEGGMAHRYWRTTGPPLPPQGTSENDRETNSHKLTHFMSEVER